LRLFLKRSSKSCRAANLSSSFFLDSQRVRVTHLGVVLDALKEQPVVCEHVCTFVCLLEVLLPVEEAVEMAKVERGGSEGVLL